MNNLKHYPQLSKNHLFKFKLITYLETPIYCSDLALINIQPIVSDKRSFFGTNDVQLSSERRLCLNTY
jgi:hypothetical protein